ncbi:MAG: LssY C-terminal domain-containing protein [Ktedonobacterales bacterium]
MTYLLSWSLSIPAVAFALPVIPAIPMSVLITIGVVLALIVLLLLLASWRLGREARQLRKASRPGREHSAQAAQAQPQGTLPTTSFARNGRIGDPLNVRVVGTASQLGLAFANAGWYRADEITLVTAWRISVDAVLGRKYSTAPVSSLFLYGRREDYAYERPGRNVRQRDHVRFWDSGQRGPDGRTLWVGGATRDIAVELSKVNHLPTHKIAPDVDDERDQLVNDLARTGWVVAEQYVIIGPPEQRVNGGGDHYQIDGRVAALTLANMPLLPFTATNVRKPLVPFVQAAGRLLRWRLPKRGNEIAQAHAANQVKTPDTIPSKRTR